METESFLLNFFQIGDKERKQFVDECINKPERFEDRIKRQRICSFATECGKRRCRGIDGKVVAACLVRDLFGSLLYLSLQKKVDIGEVLKHPLTPVPLSLCHVDGSMQKSPKSALMKYLESKTMSQPPRSVNVKVIDAMFFLHLHSNLPTSFGGVARYLLARIVECDAHTIHFVSDKWIKPSIKDCERQTRGSSSTLYQIKGHSQKRPSNCISILRNDTFKESPIEFLTRAWEDDYFAEILKDKVLYANFNDVCYRYKVEGGKMVREEAEEFYSTHEEADTRIFFHLSNIVLPSNVVVRTSDTDCLVIGLGCKHLYDPSLNIWLEVGVQSNNSQRFINMDSLYSHLQLVSIQHHFVEEGK